MAHYLLQRRRAVTPATLDSRTVLGTLVTLAVFATPAAAEDGVSGEVIEIVDRAPDQATPISYSLDTDEIRDLPGAGNDILRAAQVMPGVARIPFGFGGLVLRGASPRDTNVYIDGIAVPIAFHLGGVTSFYPSNMLSSLTLTSGGFDAAYGRTQGGLVTLATREPRTDRWRVGGEIGLLDSSAIVEGPLPGDGGIIGGIRRSYLDTVAGPFLPSDVPVPSYLDAQVRTSWGDPRRDGRITPMMFASFDTVASDEVGVTARFARAAVPYVRQWGATTLHVVPWGGWDGISYEHHRDDGAIATYDRATYSGGLRAELDRETAWGELRGGLESDAGYLGLSQTGLDDNNPLIPTQMLGMTTVSWVDFAAWTDARVQLDDGRVAIRPGLRGEHYGLGHEEVLDPRLEITQRITHWLTLRQSLGRYHQPPTPADVDPGNGNPALHSSYVDQAAIGLEGTLDGVTASVTGYVGFGTNLIVPIPHRAGDPDYEVDLGGIAPTLRELLEKESGASTYSGNLGRSRNGGIEVAIKRNAGRWYGLVSYTLAIAQRTDDPAVSVGWRPYDLDQRHNLNVVGSVRLGAWRLGARAQVVSGDPYSPTTIDPTRDFNNIVVHPWAGTLPVFFQLDVRVDRRWVRGWGDVELSFDIQNVTDRRNVEDRTFDYGAGRDVDTAGLPIIPFVRLALVPN